jgi:pimeloyl-ACP methyl ester carboxylesterase
VPSDLVLTARDGIDLAVRDHGGDGPPIVLLHGAGTHLLSLERLAARLRERQHVVTMDQRWSGQSGASDPYRWDDLVDDVECVIDELDLEDAVVAGHSWGGMIAAHYGARHPEARAVINLDGHGAGDASLYDGIDPAEVEALTHLASQPPAWVGAEGDAAWKVDQLADARAMLAASGVPERALDAFAARSFLALPDGRWRRQPSRTMFDGLVGDLRLFDVYRRIDAPFLVVVTDGTDWGPPGAERLMAAYRRGIVRALDALAGERPNVRIVELPETTHAGLTSRHAAAVATAIEDFLDQQSSTDQQVALRDR